MYTVIYRIINELLCHYLLDDTGCKTAPQSELCPRSNGQVLSMLSALLTLAVNQTSQEVRGRNVWASERRHSLSMARI